MPQVHGSCGRAVRVSPQEDGFPNEDDTATSWELRTFFSVPPIAEHAPTWREYGLGNGSGPAREKAFPSRDLGHLRGPSGQDSGLGTLSSGLVGKHGHVTWGNASRRRAWGAETAPKLGSRPPRGANRNLGALSPGAAGTRGAVTWGNASGRRARGAETAPKPGSRPPAWRESGLGNTFQPQRGANRGLGTPSNPAGR